jgi:hypothetical protein
MADTTAVWHAVWWEGGTNKQAGCSLLFVWAAAGLLAGWLEGWRAGWHLMVWLGLVCVDGQSKGWSGLQTRSATHSHKSDGAVSQC